MLVKLGYNVAVVRQPHIKVACKGQIGQPDLACRLGDTEMLAFYHSQGFDFNTKDNRFMTPLMEAARAGQSGVVRLLVESYGARVDEEDNCGATALNSAAWNGHSHCIRELVRCGADINGRDHTGWTAMCIALASHDDDSAARTLFALGARLDIHAKVPDPPLVQLALKAQLQTDGAARPGPLGDWFAFAVSGKVQPI